MATGVQVTTSAAPGPSSASQAPAATYFVTGLAERGPTAAPVVIHSMSEYADQLGARVTYGALFDDLTNYFAEGGTQAVVQRVVGPAATAGFLQLMDQAGTPLATLKVTAKSTGPWSSQLSVSVVPDLIANSFVLSIYLNGSLVERYPNLLSPAQAVTATGNSAYVVVTNLASVTAAPANNPATVGATTPVALSSGADDRASVTATVLSAALANFGAAYGTGAVAIPGQSIDTVGAAIEAHCLTFGREGLCAPALGSSPTSVKTSAAALRGSLGSEYIGCFWPWVQMSDGQGGVRTVSPEGYVAGVRARAHLSVGPWRAPAGELARSYNLIGVEANQPTDQVTASGLDDNNVSVIRIVANTVRLYGYRSLSTDSTNYQFLSDRGFLNFIASQGALLLEPFLFGTIDSAGKFFNAMADALRGLLEPIRQAGGIYASSSADGTVLDNGYLIDTGPGVNTQQRISQGIASANVAVRKAGTASLIKVQITKVAIGTAL